MQTDLSKIMNIFAEETLVKDYQPRWKAISTRQFNDTELKNIKECKVIAGQYGLSMCFTMVNGHKSWIDLDAKSELNLGDKPEAADVVMKIIQSTVELRTKAGDVIPKGKTKLVCDAIVHPKEDTRTVEEKFDNPFGI